jgi:hypothetical protein
MKTPDEAVKVSVPVPIRVIPVYVLPGGNVVPPEIIPPLAIVLVAAVVGTTLLRRSPTASSGGGDDGPAGFGVGRNVRALGPGICAVVGAGADPVTTKAVCPPEKVFPVKTIAAPRATTASGYVGLGETTNRTRRGISIPRHDRHPSVAGNNREFAKFNEFGRALDFYNTKGVGTTELIASPVAAHPQRENESPEQQPAERQSVEQPAPQASKHGTSNVHAYPAFKSLSRRHRSGTRHIPGNVQASREDRNHSSGNAPVSAFQVDSLAM